jgi:hypothetical protein
VDQASADQVRSNDEPRTGRWDTRGHQAGWRRLAGQPQAATEPARAILPLLEALQQSVAEQAANGAAPRAKERASRKRAKRTA